MPNQSGPGSRVVICCYCDARSLLPRDGAGRLVCHGCGAPIRLIQRMEPSHLSRAGARDAKPPTPRRAERPEEHGGRHDSYRRRKSKKKGKRREKSLFARLADVADDVFDLDDILDIFD